MVAVGAMLFAAAVIAEDRPPVAFSQSLVVSAEDDAFGVQFDFVDPDFTGHQIYFPTLEILEPVWMFPRVSGGGAIQSCVFYFICGFYIPEGTTAGTYTLAYALTSHNPGDEESEGLTSEPATITVTVVPTIDKPYAFAQSVATYENLPRPIVLRGVTPDGAQPNFEITHTPTSGELDLATDEFGTIATYTPSAGFVGADRFEFRVVDGLTFSESAPIEIAVLTTDGPVLIAATPDRAIATQPFRAVISGTNLANATSVSFPNGSMSVDATIETASDRELTFVASGLRPGRLDISVITPSGRATLLEAMHLEEAHNFIVSAVLPAARSIQVGQPATTLATIVNGGNLPAEKCVIRPEAALPATFAFQTTDPITHALTGEEDAPATIPAGQAQDFVIAFTPTAPFELQSVPLVFECDGALRAPKFDGVNTFLLSASSVPVPDIVAVTATPLSAGRPNTVSIAGAGAQEFFAVAVFNAGSAGVISVNTDTGAVPLPLSMSVCIDPADCFAGAALSPVAIPAAGVASFYVLVSAQDSVSFQPGDHRVFVRFLDQNQVVRGATSVAVTTQ